MPRKRWWALTTPIRSVPKTDPMTAPAMAPAPIDEFDEEEEEISDVETGPGPLGRKVEPSAATVNLSEEPGYENHVK